jgi:hypothetical protein
MNPKEQAKVMIDEFYKIHSNSASDLTMKFAIKASLIAVDYLIHTIPSVNSRPPNYQEVNKFCSEYWQEVKKELDMFDYGYYMRSNPPMPPSDRILRESKEPLIPKIYLK